jgi:hypothetical protein
VAARVAALVSHHDPVREWGQVRLVLADRRARHSSPAVSAPISTLGWPEQTAGAVHRRVSGRSGDRHLEHHLHDYAIQRKLMHTRTCVVVSERLAC